MRGALGAEARSNAPGEEPGCNSNGGPHLAGEVASRQLQAVFRLRTPLGVRRRASSAAAGACVRCTRVPRTARARVALGWPGRGLLLLSREPHAQRGRIDVDAAIGADLEPLVAAQESSEPLDEDQRPLGVHVDSRVAHREGLLVKLFLVIFGANDRFILPPYIIYRSSY